jgi:hypothetical protein
MNLWFTPNLVVWMPPMLWLPQKFGLALNSRPPPRLRSALANVFASCEMISPDGQKAEQARRLTRGLARLSIG